MCCSLLCLVIKEVITIKKLDRLREQIKMIKIFIFFVISLSSINVFPTLGGSIDSIDNDRVTLSAVEKTTINKTNYSVKEIKTDGATIREYISLSGVVFGIAWRGIAHPDLEALLGDYAPEYKKELKQNPPKAGNRHHHLLKTSNIIVEKWGHMRNLQGRMYIPSFLPTGVTPNEIK